MTKYTEHLWKSKVLNKALLEGKTRIPCVRALPLPIPIGFSRDDEVKPEAAIEGVQASVDALKLVSGGWCLKIEIVFGNI